MSGEVQPRRRRDRKKKKAQLEALAKEEWEEGAALYGAEPEEEEEETIQTARDLDSRSSDEDEITDEAELNQSMPYKVILFILLLVLGAVAGLVLVEHSVVDFEDVDVGLDSSAEVDHPLSAEAPESSVWNSAGMLDNGRADGPLDGMLDDKEETSFFESLGGFINEFLEVDSVDNEYENHPTTEKSEPLMESLNLVTEENAPPGFAEAVEGKLKEISNENHAGPEGFILEAKVTEVPAIQTETQIEDPVNAGNSETNKIWLPMHPREVNQDIPSVVINEPISSNDNNGNDDIRETAPNQDAFPHTSNQQQLIDVPQTSNPESATFEDEIVVDEIM